MNEKTFLQLALHSYDNPSCISVDEFKADLERFSYIKKIFNKYLDGSGQSNERLVLNHLVICFNIFGNAALDLVFYKVDQNQWGVLIPYLIFLNRIPEDYKIAGQMPLTNVKLDQVIINKLREL